MPEQHDPIDELARFGAGFGSATPGGDMPLSAADVRRRGDQIRRRRTALVAGGAALAVAAVAVPVFAVIGNDSPRSDKDNLADDKTHPALAESDLLRDADTEYDREGYSLFETTDTFEGDGQATYLPCQRDKISALGATSSFTRTFNLYPNPEKMEPGDVPDDQTTEDLVELVAEFETSAAARAAYDQFAEWIVDCKVPGADAVNVAPQARSVTLPESDAVIYDLTWRPAPIEIDPTGDAGYINETGLVLQDDRIAVVSVTIIGQDYNYDPEFGSPVERMLPPAAERLRPGTEPDRPTEPTATETSEADDPDPGTGDPDTDPGAVAIPDDFPLLDGWPDQAGDGEGRIGPARDLEPIGVEVCGQPLPDPGHADRLIARFDDVEDYRTRQLTTFASAEEAVAAVAAVRELFESCPKGPVREDGYTPNWEVRDTSIGGESFAVLGWDTLDGSPTTFGDTLLVVRLGSSVLVVAHSGHSGNPQGRETEVVEQIVRESASVVDRMCTWTAAGC